MNSLKSTSDSPGNAFGSEIFNESLAEITEIVDRVISTFIEIEKNNNLKNDEKTFDSLMRDIHSIKGAFGMINLEHEMKIVHKTETFLLESYKIAGFSQGILDLMIDLWEQLAEIVNTQQFGRDLVSKFTECFGCLKKSKYAHVCNAHNNGGCSPVIPDNKVVILDNTEKFISNQGNNKAQAKNQDEENKEVIIPTQTLYIGTCKDMAVQLNEENIRFANLSCINSVYRKYRHLPDVNRIVVDVATLGKSPLLLQETLLFFNQDIKFCYLLENKEQLVDMIDIFEDINMNFTLIFKSSPSYKRDILDFLKQCK